MREGEGFYHSIDDEEKEGQNTSAEISLPYEIQHSLH
jgi:hypothetical protein